MTKQPLPLLYIIAILFISACKPDALQLALEEAGDNRTELEKVLQHYSTHREDSLKLKAAQDPSNKRKTHLALTRQKDIWSNQLFFVPSPPVNKQRHCQ